MAFRIAMRATSCIVGVEVRGLVSHRKGWIAFGVAVALLFVGLPVGLFAILSGLYGSERGRAQAGEVLAGRVAGPERLSALAAVSEWANSVHVPGTNSVAVVLYTTCSEGQNNWKVHDGYRLQCSAGAIRYSSWSGGYSKVAGQAGQSLTSRCDAVTATSDVAPQPGEPTTGVFDCPEGRVWLELGSSKILFPEDDAVSQGNTTRSRERYSGPTPKELVGLLKQHEWFAIHQVRKVYFQDQP